MTDKVKEYLERLGQLAEAIEAGNGYMAAELARELSVDLEIDTTLGTFEDEEAA